MGTTASEQLTIVASRLRVGTADVVFTFAKKRFDALPCPVIKREVLSPGVILRRRSSGHDHSIDPRRTTEAFSRPELKLSAIGFR